LSWTHLLALIPLKDPLQREFYAEMCCVERWSVRTLRKKIDSMLYERTAISKKPDELAKDLLARLAHQRAVALTTQREYELLEVAARLGEFTNSQLAAESGMQKQNVNRALKKLLDLNLVRIRQDEDGGEAYAVVDEMRLLGSRASSNQPSSRS